jgi:hypothetical protein
MMMAYKDYQQQLKKAEEKRRRLGMRSLKDMPPVICRQCGKSFKAKNIRATCCSPECSRKWFSKNRKRDTPEEKKDRRLRDNHGITPEFIKQKIQQQNNRCALCGEPFDHNNFTLRPCLDHNHGCCPKNHSCAECRRDIIHQRCNLIIGWTKDNPHLLIKALDYLRKWE